MAEIDLPPLYEDLTFLSPLSQQRAEKLCQFIATHAKGTILDAGCGWGSLLIQLLAGNSSLSGIGIDLNDGRIAHAQQVAQERGIAERLTLIAGDANAHLPAKVEGVICLGSSQIWASSTENNQPLDYKSALQAMRHLLKAGAPAVFGEAIWSAEPTPSAAKPLSGRLDEFVFLPDLLDIARQCGFVVVGAHQASLDEWDQFESGFTAGYARWLATHSNEHPHAPEVRKRLVAQSDAYFRGYRGVLGMAYLELLAV